MTIDSLLENIATLSVNDQRDLLRVLAYKLEISIDPLEFTNRKAALLIEDIQRVDSLEWQIRGLVLTTIKLNDILYLDKNTHPELQFQILEMNVYGHLLPQLDSGDHPWSIRVKTFVEIPILNFIRKLYKDRE